MINNLALHSEPFVAKQVSGEHSNILVNPYQTAIPTNGYTEAIGGGGLKIHCTIMALDLIEGEAISVQFSQIQTDNFVNFPGFESINLSLGANQSMMLDPIEVGFNYIRFFNTTSQPIRVTYYYAMP